MRFILYGRYDSDVYTNASMATYLGSYPFDYVNTGGEHVLIAFKGGCEVGRTYDMSKLGPWVTSLVSGTPRHEDPVEYVQDPLPGLETPPCR